MTTEAPIVRVSSFSKRYGKHIAVEDVSLSVQRGEIYGLIGPDGAGKSSLMKAIAGVLTFEAGTVEVMGTPLTSEESAEHAKASLGFMPQGLGLNLYPDLSVEENIEFFAQLRLVPEVVLAQRKAKLLASTRLEPFRRRAMRHLSGGMKQKLGLICSLIHEPNLVILDEPTTGVDPVSRREFWRILMELIQERSMTALVSTAYLEEATRFHHLSFVFKGRVLASGSPAEIQGLVPGSILTFQAAPQAETLARLKASFPHVETRGPWFRILTEGAGSEDACDRVEQSLGDIRPQHLHVTEPEFEDVFVSLLLRQGTTTATRRLSGSAVEIVVGDETADGLAIEAKGLVRDFGAFRAVDHATFQAKRGTIFGLLGANGAGKTTVIKMLTGIVPPTAGKGRVAGADMRTSGAAIKERIGYMSQAFSLYLDLTVTENLRLFAGIYGLGKQETANRLDWIIEMTGLAGYESDRTSRLPMGVRQRLALGCALVHRPQVLFLDEPTSGVDPVGRRQFWDILVRLSRADGVTVLVTTHYLSEAEHCDQLALMYGGRVVAEGSPVELKQRTEQQAGYLFEIIADQPGKAVVALQHAGFAGVALFGTRLRLFCRDPVRDRDCACQALEATGIRIQSAIRRPLSLEDVFVYTVMALEAKEEAHR